MAPVVPHPGMKLSLITFIKMLSAFQYLSQLISESDLFSDSISLPHIVFSLQSTSFFLPASDDSAKLLLCSNSSYYDMLYQVCHHGNSCFMLAPFLRLILHLSILQPSHWLLNHALFYHVMYTIDFICLRQTILMPFKYLYLVFSLLANMKEAARTNIFSCSSITKSTLITEQIKWENNILK